MKRVPLSVTGLLLLLQAYFTLALIHASSWPHFYDSGLSTHPTQSLLNNLTYYRTQWQLLQQKQKFGQTYTFVMAWDCTPCDLCLQANKLINVDNGIITSVKTSQVNDQKKLDACEALNHNNNNNNNSSSSSSSSEEFDSNDEILSEYRTIDELYNMSIAWMQSSLDKQEQISSYLVVELMLHPTYLFPESVKLSQAQNWMAWDISCFVPGHETDEDIVCHSDASDSDSDSEEYISAPPKEKHWTFWLSKPMQSFLGWSMICLILIACSLGYCINYLKKKKAEKIEAWRAKERQKAEEEEELERQKRQRRKSRNGKPRRKSKNKKSNSSSSSSSSRSSKRHYKVDRNEYIPVHNKVNDEEEEDDDDDVVPMIEQNP